MKYVRTLIETGDTETEHVLHNIRVLQKQVLEALEPDTTEEAL
jgi:hypothetical protein